MEGDGKGDLKGVVIITLPPPESPSDGKILCAAFTYREHPQHHDQEAQNQQYEEFNAPQIDQLPLHHRSQPPRQPRRFRPFRSKRIASFLFLGLVAFFIWQYGPSSLNVVEDDSNSEESDRSMVYSIYSKLLVATTLNSSQYSDSSPASPTGSSSPAAITKLVERDVVRNNRIGSKAVPSSKVDGASSTVFPLRGNVYPHGLYYVTLKVGNPPRPYYLDVDTGSDLTWLQCDAPCSSCAKGPHPLYKPRKSSLVGCKEAICSHVQAGGSLACRDGTTQCDYEIEYADGGSSMGVLVTDTMSLLLANGTSVQTKSVFGCAYDQQGSLANSPAPTDGVLGLSTSRASLPFQWTEQGLIKNIIGHCIAGNGKGGGYLFFGDKLLPSLGITWAPMLGKPSAKNYAVAVENIYFGDALISMKDNAFGSAVFDSGTSYTYFVTQAYEALVSIVLNSLAGSGLERDRSDPTLPICWQGSSPFSSVEDVQHLFKTVTLEFKGSGWLTKIRKMQIPPEGYLIVNAKGNLCLGVLDAGVLGDTGANIIGDISMQGNLVIYDNVNNRMGWMKTDCRKLPRAATLSSSM